jgi:hypothetical protein
MRRGRRSIGRALRIGALVACLAAALILPSVALAANTATFTNVAPASGATEKGPQPTIQVIVKDKYGVKGSSNFYMKLDGVKVPAKRTDNNSTYSNFKLTYKTPPLSIGSHTVYVWVKDQRAKVSTKKWTFTHIDGTAPVTTSDVLTFYTGTATIHLNATDSESGVAHTYYRIDNGPQTEGTVIVVPAADSTKLHWFKAWSVDNAGNAEAQPDWSFFQVAPLQSHPTPANSCTSAGCHAQNIAAIHAGVTTLAPNGDTVSFACLCHTSSEPVTSNCQNTACHGTSPALFHSAGTHPSLASTSTGALNCTQASCHANPGGALAIHTSCLTCHNSTDPIVKAAVSNPSGNASCETCHNYAALHAPGSAHVVPGLACYSASCHSHDVSVIHTGGDNPPGCFVCHNLANPSDSTGATTTCEAAGCHTNIAGYHDFTHANATGTKSSACTSCHGTDLPTVHANSPMGGCLCHFQSFLRAEMAPLLTAGAAQCVDCHKGPYAVHGFASTTNTPAVSGHNTTTYGTVGANSDFSASGVVVKNSVGATITQEWPLPTADVFWSQSKALNLDGTVNGSGVYSLNPTDAPAVALSNKGFTGDPTTKINKTVGWGSTITCQDCHTNLDSSMGPQGANAGQIGLDPNFPDDWTKAELSSFDPTGMRSIATTQGSPNPYYPRLGATMFMPANSSDTTSKANVWSNGVITPGPTTIYAGGFFDATSTASTGYSPGSITGRFICIKCHKLTNSYQGLGIAGNGRGFRDNLLNYMGMSNEAHMEHHNDLITGQGNCVSCHVAIPHGWNRPRLLVYESDSAPYKVQYYFPNYSSSSTQSAVYQLNQDLSGGNWGYLGWNGNGKQPSTGYYKLVGAAIPNGVANGLNGRDASDTVIVNTGKTYSSHLEKLSASSFADKELEIGTPADYASMDTTNGTTWGKWLATAEGVGWLGDTNPNAIYKGTVQNNCNACTSAGTTHSDTGGSAEGIGDSVSMPSTWTAVPYWK